MSTKCIDMTTRRQVRSLAGKLMEEWQNIDAVAEALGCHPRDIRRWHNEYRQNVTARDPFVKEPGRPPKLTENQQNIIRDIIFSKSPRELDHDVDLWSNLVICDTIHDLFRTKLSLGTVNSLTQKMGIVRRQFFRQNGAPENYQVIHWQKHRFPSIRKLAKEEKARILFIHDEVLDISESTHFEKSANDLSEHRQPSPREFEKRLFSAICPRNSQRFLVFTGPFAPQPFITFLKGLINDIDRKLFLIAEGYYKPLALEADSFLSEVADRLSLFFLPKNGVSRG